MVLLYQNRRASNIQYPHSLIHETSQQGSSANHHLLFAIRRIISQKVGDHCILQDRGLVTGYCGNPILTIRCRKCSNFGTASVTATTEISGPSTHASFPQSLLIVFFHPTSFLFGSFQSQCLVSLKMRLMRRLHTKHIRRTRDLQHTNL